MDQRDTPVEESSEREGHPFGGPVWAVAVNSKAIGAAPALGCAPWKNVTLISDVQAHSLTGGRITSENLVQGGQIFFLRRVRPNAGR